MVEYNYNLNTPRLAMYRVYAKHMRTGDMLEWQSDTFIGKTIRLFTKKDVNHTGLVVVLEEFQGLKNRRFTVEALSGGVELRLLGGRCLEHKGKLFWYPLKEKYDAFRPAIGAWAVQMVGAGIKYDYGSLFANAVSRVSVNVKKLYCTETVQEAYTVVGLLPQLPAMRPGDLEQFGLHHKSLLVYDSERGPNAGV